MNKALYNTTLFFASLLLFAPFLALAQYSGGDDGLSTFGQDIVKFINNILVPFVFSVALLLFIYGVFLYFFVSGGDDEKRKTGRNYMLWAIGALVVMVSVWGIVNLIAGGLGFTKDDLGNTFIPAAGGTR